jgi:hypothetical protein
MEAAELEHAVFARHDFLYDNNGTAYSGTRPAVYDITITRRKICWKNPQPKLNFHLVRG